MLTWSSSAHFKVFTCLEKREAAILQAEIAFFSQMWRMLLTGILCQNRKTQTYPILQQNCQKHCFHTISSHSWRGDWLLTSFAFSELISLLFSMSLKKDNLDFFFYFILLYSGAICGNSDFEVAPWVTALYCQQCREQLWYVSNIGTAKLPLLGPLSRPLILLISVSWLKPTAT